MASTRALSLPTASAPFETIDLDRRELRDDDVLIDIAFAGICHSDIHTGRDEWGAAHYPLTPGHEIAGTVAAVGPAVTKFAVGDRVGVGVLVDSCGTCEQCKDGHEMFCLVRRVETYNSQGFDGAWTEGGYSQQIVVTERFVVRIPDAIELDVAAPLLCAGITTYSPLVRWGAGPGKKVGVIGVGGLGHIGVQLAVAMGAEVTTLSRSDAKAADAIELGATQHIASSDPDAMAAAAGTLDIIINSVSADIDVATYMKLLAPYGVLVNLGIPESPYIVPGSSLFGGNKSISASVVGGLQQTQEMLDFCAANGVAAVIQRVDASDPAAVDQAWDDVVAGKVRYRYVIDTATI